MPIYEYNCPKCGHFEAIQGFSDKPLKCKPDCQEKGCPKKAERVMSASAFHLKGSGWYKTDYSSGSSGGSTASKKASTTSSGEAGSSGGDKKEGSSLQQAKCGTKCGCH
jgi:putative FmdB family regulatory protein